MRVRKPIFAIAAGWVVLFLGVAVSISYAAYVQNESQETDRLLIQENAAQAQFNCKEIESVKASLRAVFTRLTRFNTDNAAPLAQARAELYAGFVRDYFSPEACPRT